NKREERFVNMRRQNSARKNKSPTEGKIQRIHGGRKSTEEVFGPLDSLMESLTIGLNLIE
ncbi:MAG: hypothetical protein WAK21_08625, partial [Candidatus Sulfotelmatobacter sp.]